ncbi:MAG: hypothetical protein AAGD22_11090 [Verrucomicrobiota bacterium]
MKTVPISFVFGLILIASSVLTGGSMAVVTAVFAGPPVMISPLSSEPDSVERWDTGRVAAGQDPLPLILKPDGSSVIVSAHSRGQPVGKGRVLLDLDGGTFAVDTEARALGGVGGFGTGGDLRNGSTRIFSFIHYEGPSVPVGPGTNVTFGGTGGGLDLPEWSTVLLENGSNGIRSMDVRGRLDSSDIYFSSERWASGVLPLSGIRDGSLFSASSPVLRDAASYGLGGGSHGLDALKVISKAAGAEAFLSVTSSSAVFPVGASEYELGSGADIFLFDPAGVLGSKGLSKYLDAEGVGLGALSE